MEMRDRTVKIGQAKAGIFKQNPRNPKTHPPKQLERLNAIFDRYGQIGVLIVYKSKRNGDEWTIFDGHARREYDPEQVWNVLYTNLSDEEVDNLSFMYDEVAKDADPIEEILKELLQEANAAVQIEGDEVLDSFIRSIAMENAINLDWLNDNDEDLDNVDFKEYGEEIENEVEYITCPHCEGKFPK